MSRLLALSVALCLPLLSSCGDTSELFEHTELQSFCASSGNGTDGEVTALTVTVEFDLCLSSSCDTLMESSCEFTRDGDELTLTGLALVESQTKGACTSDCGRVSAQCTQELDNGTYLLRAGEAMLEYELGTPAACSND